VGVCPTKAITMEPQESQLDQQDVFDYCVANVSEKADMAGVGSVKDSQFKTPLLEFSGSCAGCAETSYARLVTQVCGDRMYVSNATGCSSIWGGPAATSPYTVNKEGKGPAWANSLFEDNAEHGLGFFYGQKAIRDRITGKLEEMMVSDKTSASCKAAIQAWMDTKNDGAANAEPTKALIAELETAAKAGCPLSAQVLEHKEFLSKKSIWIFGGDGWAYDIGFGGLDHVLASGEDVNVMVFDTEVYSNTGGQASKSTNFGAVAQFAAAGKSTPKKSLSEIAMSYGYVYVAQVAMGANPNQTLAAIREAEAYHGPSLVIGYSPCEMHSIKGGMLHCQEEMKKAVECGYWNLFRFNPDLKKEGKSPFTLDSKAPAGGYQEFLMNEARYSALTRSFPDRAKELFAKNEEAAKARYEHLTKLVELYK
jgi:pyruvate-ferredoxin/flavodoxin oxidoreductase